MIALLQFSRSGNDETTGVFNNRIKFNRDNSGRFKKSRILAISALLIASFCAAHSTRAEPVIQEPSQNTIDPAIHELNKNQPLADLQTAEPAGLADWPALFQALNRTTRTEGRIVSFRELWDAKPNELNDALKIHGRVIRRFRREAVGQFPALQELWIRTDDDGLIVVTTKAPQSGANQSPNDPTKPGSDVALTGYFLRKVQYEAEDSARIAPWIVAREIHRQHSGSFLENEISGENVGQSWTLLILVTAMSAAALRLIVVIVQRQFRR